MQGLGVRIARRLNRVMGRTGRVMSDRYHAHLLKTPAEVKAARVYLAGNAAKHYGRVTADPFVSRVAVIAPRTWLLAHMRANL
jgi:hypothetical protein